MPMNKTFDDFKADFSTKFSSAAQEIESVRQSMAPNYKKFWKKVGFFGLILIVCEATYWIQTQGEVEGLMSIPLTAAIMLFGSIIKGIIHGASSDKIQVAFLSVLGPALAKYFTSGYEYKQAASITESELRESGIFDNHSGYFTLSSEFTVDKHTRFFSLDFDYHKLTSDDEYEKPLSPSATNYEKGIMRGMMLVKDLSYDVSGKVLLLPDYLEGTLGPDFTRGIELVRDKLKEYDFYVNPNRQHGEKEAQQSGDSTWGKTTERLEDVEFEKRFRVYSEGNPNLNSILSSKHRQVLIELVNDLKLPISIAYSGRRMFVYVDQGPFFDISPADLFEDFSQVEFYERYYQDLLMANKTVERLEAI